MIDPYVLENGTLKNKLGITDYNELNRAEKDIGYVNLLNAEEILKEKCDIDLIKKINRHIFEAIFEWAGEFRTVPLYKREVVLPGLSLEYAQPQDIERLLKQRIDEMNEYDWKNKGIDEITKKFTYFLARIWRIHPFRDGNTRTVLTFGNIFAKQNGFEMDMSTMLDNLGRIKDPKTKKIVRYSVRDKFVLAALDEKDYPEPQYLEAIIKKAIENGINKKIDSLNRIVDNSEEQK